MTVNVKALGKTAEIEIFGDIGMWDDTESVDSDEIAAGIKKSSGKDLRLVIDSFGGSVTGGMKILSAMNRHDGNLSADINVSAYSIASAIASNAPVTSMAANGMIMVHAPWAEDPRLAQGNAAQFRETADTLDSYADAIASAYARKDGPSRETVDAWLKDGKDHLFPAPEALRLGLIDSITAQSMDIAACYRPPERFSIAAAAVTNEETMSKENVADGGQALPVTPDAAAPTKETVVPTFMAQHKAATESGQQKGIRAEHSRQKAVRAQFYDQNGNFSFGDETDRGDPMLALMNDCLGDINCSETEALRRITGAFKDGYKPVPVAAGHQPGDRRAPSMREMDIPKFKAGADSSDKVRDGMVMATMSRMGRNRVDYQNPWRGHTLMDLARDCMVKAGYNPYGIANRDLASRVLNLQTTSDFPIILENTLHKLVLAGFESAPATYPQFCKIGSVGDLREWKRITPGLLSDLEEQDEGGDYRSKPIPDGEAESVSAKLIGNIIGITANVLINDDLNYIDSRARGIGMAGQRTVERKVWALLAANPTMSDGNALFSAAHGNLVDDTNAPIGDPTIDAVDQMCALLAEQTAPAAKDDPSPTVQYLDLMPYAAVAHRWRQSVLKVINSSTTDITQAPGTALATGLPFDGLFPNSNPMAGTFTNIATSVLAARVPWFMFANPDIAPIIEVVFLNGQREPTVVMEEDFNSSGLKWKVEYPHGVGAVGWRGAVMNPGE